MSEVYKDKTKRAKERAADLLSRMTLQEKVAQMVQIPYSEIPKEESLMWAERGAGSFLHVLGDNARELQSIALSSRLGIPFLFGIDAIHGHGLHYGATIFPSQLAMACTWDSDLVMEMGRVTAREVAADGLHWTFSPVLCLGRDTRWGRVDETFGEDPYLTGELGAAMVKGYQGDDLAADDSILACAKHYIGYGDAIGARDACNTEMTFRKLRDVFLPPFQKAVEAGCSTIMTAYGAIDGTPFTASEKALRTILKDELSFDGFIVTDWNNTGNLANSQYVAEDIGEAACLAVKAGNDMIMTTPDFYDAAIKQVEGGKLDEKYIDEAVLRILTIKFSAGLFEKPEKTGRPDIFGCEAHLKSSLQASRESVTMLENRSVLPFSSEIRSIAVIGPNADDLRAQYGDWTYFTHPRNNPTIEPAAPNYTVLSGIREVAKELDINVVYHKGCDVLSSDNAEADIEAAVQAAQGCDAIVLVVGDVYAQFGEGKDRADLALSGGQQALFDRLRSINRPLTTVLVASKPLCITKVAEKSDALLTMFNGGQYGGLAVAEVLFGRLNPSGKLPISFPHHSGQVPVYYNQLPGWHGGKYCDLPAEPLYSFGYGLSYTAYEYSGLTANADGSHVNVTVDVKNTGQQDGIEIAQLYFNDVVTTVITPIKQLAAFERVHLGAGETKTLTFKLDYSQLSIVTPDEKRVTEPGEFIIMVGGDSRNASLLKTSVVI